MILSNHERSEVLYRYCLSVPISTFKGLHKPSKYLVLVLILILLTILPAILRPENFIADDSYFYQQVAHNASLGYGLTFSRITPTNGFHPLWMVDCIFIHLVANTNKILALKYIVINQGILFLLKLLILWRICNQFKWKISYVSIAILMFFFLTGMFGSEAHLNGLFLMLMIYTGILALLEPCFKSWIVFGIVLGFTFLARLDTIFIVASTYFSCAYYMLAIKHVKKFFMLLVPVLIAAGIVAPYLIYNILQYKHIVPISGAIKSTFPNIVFSIDKLPMLGWLSVFTAIGTVLFLVHYRNSIPKGIHAVLHGFTAGMILQIAYLIFFSESGAISWSWYYVPVMVILAIDIIIIVNTGILLQGKSRILFTILTAIIMLFSVGRSWSRYFNGVNSNAVFTGDLECKNRWQYDLALWMKENMPQGSKIFTYDSSGMIAYWSDQNILPVDGLINDFEYQRLIVSKGISQYLEDNNIEYYLGIQANHIDVYSWLSGEHAGRLQLTDEGLILDSDTLGVEGMPRLGIYKLQ